MQVCEKRGIVFRASHSAQGELYVDAHGLRNSQALITHAHADHAKATASNKYYMTPETALLVKPNPMAQFCEVAFGKKFSMGDFSCTFHKSGHILGSAQVEVVNGSQAVLTSDFKLQKSILFEGAQILPSETLIIETTFGTPEYSFPSRDAVYEDMIRWMHSRLAKKKFIVLGGYSTGKAQELTKIVNEFLGETPLVHRRIFEQNNAYENAGVKLGNYIELDHNLNEANILILPPHMINDHVLLAIEHQIGKKVEPAIATGWRHHSKYKTFPLSDHADFNGLVEYVKQSSPKMVFTTHGFEREFASYVSRRMGICAKPLSEAGQTLLSQFG
ncbi:MAG: MBL fold metallo-hydrolase [archaeon]|nr:MBL fold metallo-hydrolase [archaeon]